jgi:exosortase C (VPDSG-CTERM-specific)
MRWIPIYKKAGAEEKCYSPAARRGLAALPRPAANFILFSLVLTVSFWKPLFDLARFSFKDDLYSHTLLVPFISFYLIWIKRKVLPTDIKASLGAALAALVVGAVALGGYWLMIFRGWEVAQEDYLSITLFSFYSLLVAAGLGFWGSGFMRAVAFPVGFLVLMVPFPSAVTYWIETFFQHTSADAASVLFSLTGLPVFRERLVFHLPGIAIQVAKECSGIHSTLVLFITSLLAGHLFLRSPWKKAAMVLAVIPLGIARNGIRIFTISWLCVHVGPAMIDSPIHHRGGPIFFMLSLAPFFALLFLLRRSERPGKASESAVVVPPAENL